VTSSTVSDIFKVIFHNQRAINELDTTKNTTTKELNISSSTRFIGESPKVLINHGKPTENYMLKI
jgi:hypothetical protein